MATLKFVNINKIYDNNVQAVFDFNLEVQDKEFIVFVGPSGCGKSTTLRMVAGLEEITSGDLYIDDKLVNNLEPKDRDIAMVFQNYALYPHMTVYENMSFSLKLKKIPRDEIDLRVEEAANILGLSQYLNRKPKALSGGQRQRVALGRAIVRHPKVFLMDEPLSNLDAKLRVQMRTEIAKIHKKVGATTIYVTHDQTEAMTMASRIVVMKDGYVQQIGTPREVYNMPANVFVGGFIGSPAMNFFKGKLSKNSFIITDENNQETKIVLDKEKVKILNDFIKDKEIKINQTFEENLNSLNNEYEEERNKLVNQNIPQEHKKKLEAREKNIENLDVKYKEEKDNLTNEHDLQLKNLHEIILGVRPEDIYVENDINNKNPSTTINIECDVAELLGHETIVYGYIGGQRVVIKTSSANEISQGDKLIYQFDMNKVHFFDPTTTNRI